MSKKYVIDLPDDAQYILINGASENHCYTRVEQVDDLEELNSDYINEHYGELQDDAYKRGYKNGRNVGIKDGMCEAWEAARKIVVDTNHGGIALCTLGEIFGAQSYTYIMTDNTAQEAIDKLKAYEHKDSDRSEVGDEVATETGIKYTVVSFGHGGTVCGFNTEGKWTGWKPKEVTKTGKHYDIASILEAMRT